MIHRITANKASFQTVELKRGLNIILADRTETSKNRDTRNGLGKTLLVEIIHFCLGSRVEAGRGLVVPALSGWSFTLDLTLMGARVRVTREIDQHDHVLLQDVPPNWSQYLGAGVLFAHRRVKIQDWKKFLSRALFGIVTDDGNDEPSPSARSLISYFVRRGPDAFVEPFRYTRQQRRRDRQVQIAFLLGLNWRYAAKWQTLKEKEEGLKSFSVAIAQGATEYASGSIGELQAERIQLEGEVERETRALKSFKVHAQYDRIQRDADRLTKLLHSMTNRNVADRRRLAKYRDSVRQEVNTSADAVQELYSEAGVVFAAGVKRTLQEAEQFYSKIVENRRSFLGIELSRLERRIEDRNRRIKRITGERARALEILETHGALEEMAKLQERLTRTRERLERVKSRIGEILDLHARGRRITLEKTELFEVTERDHEERRSTWSKPVRWFAENSNKLYEDAGRLIIDVRESGFHYDVEIKRSESEGVGKMKIFCFDLAVLQAMAGRVDTIDFVVHDSGLYDGVDARQRALALERAAELTEMTQTQYICTMNSDMVPEEDFSQGFDFGQYVRLTLTDTRPEGRLLGFEFEALKTEPEEANGSSRME